MITWIFALLFTLSVPQLTANKINSDPWDVIDSRVPPKWHDKSKFGILIHFGVYTESKIGSEWLWYELRKKQIPAILDYMKSKSSGYTYQNLAADFKPLFFNADDWADIVQKSGARYLVITSKHHDGFTLYNSSYSSNWNSIDVGPHINIMAELKNATSLKRLKFGIFYSLLEWFHPLYMKDRTEGTQNFVDQKILPELKEIVENFQPDYIWTDGEWEMSEDYWKSTDFLTWLFTNSSVKRSVAVNDRWGAETLCKHGSFITCNGKSKTLQEKKFENLIPMDRLSWGFNVMTKIEHIMSVDSLIYELVSTVACNGNLLLNIGANADGIIENIYVERLETLGLWLRVNGEGIFGTRPFWKQQEDSNAIWYTFKIRGHYEEIFIFVLEYPYDSNEIELSELGGVINDETEITLLGFMQKIEFSFKGEKIVIKFPDKRIIDQFGLSHAWTFKILNRRKK